MEITETTKVELIKECDTAQEALDMEMALNKGRTEAVCYSSGYDNGKWPVVKLSN